MDDPHHLQRFVQAQAPVYGQVVDELRAGVKRSHWMWFVFPQLAGLGFSAMARHYAIASLAEAQAYLAHPLLGARLRECAQLVLAIEGRSIHGIFGAPDDLKFHSCVTLFGQAQPGEALFQRCLQKYFAGQGDPQTIALLRRAGGQAS